MNFGLKTPIETMNSTLNNLKNHSPCEIVRQYASMPTWPHLEKTIVPLGDKFNSLYISNQNLFSPNMHNNWPSYYFLYIIPKWAHGILNAFKYLSVVIASYLIKITKSLKHIKKRGKIKDIILRGQQWFCCLHKKRKWDWYNTSPVNSEGAMHSYSCVIITQFYSRFPITLLKLNKIIFYEQYISSHVYALQSF